MDEILAPLNALQKKERRSSVVQQLGNLTKSVIPEGALSVAPPDVAAFKSTSRPNSRPATPTTKPSTAVNISTSADSPSQNVTVPATSDPKAPNTIMISVNVRPPPRQVKKKEEEPPKEEEAKVDEVPHPSTILIPPRQVDSPMYNVIHIPGKPGQPRPASLSILQNNPLMGNIPHAVSSAAPGSSEASNAHGSTNHAEPAPPTNARPGSSRPGSGRARRSSASEAGGQASLLSINRTSIVRRVPNAEEAGSSAEPYSLASSNMMRGSLARRVSETDSQPVKTEESEEALPPAPPMRTIMPTGTIRASMIRRSSETDNVPTRHLDDMPSYSTAAQLRYMSQQTMAKRPVAAPPPEEVKKAPPPEPEPPKPSGPTLQINPSILRRSTASENQDLFMSTTGVNAIGSQKVRAQSEVTPQPAPTDDLHPLPLSAYMAKKLPAVKNSVLDQQPLSASVERQELNPLPVGAYVSPSNVNTEAQKLALLNGQLRASFKPSMAMDPTMMQMQYPGGVGMSYGPAGVTMQPAQYSMAGGMYQQFPGAPMGMQMQYAPVQMVPMQQQFMPAQIMMQPQYAGMPMGIQPQYGGMYNTAEPQFTQVPMIMPDPSAPHPGQKAGPDKKA